MVDPAFTASHADPRALETIVRHVPNLPRQRSLRAPDLLAVLGFAEKSVTITGASAVPSMLEALANLVGANSATLTRINLRTGHELAVLWPPARAESARLELYAAVSRTHPLRPALAHQARAGSRRPAPIRISDVLTKRQWRGSALYASSHRGVDDQMCVLIAAQQHTVQLVAVNRQHGSFTDRQAALLDAARAHLAAAVQRIGQQTLVALELAPTLRRVLAPVAIPRGTAGGPLVVKGRARGYRPIDNGRSWRWSPRVSPTPRSDVDWG